MIKSNQRKRVYFALCFQRARFINGEDDMATGSHKYWHQKQEAECSHLNHPQEAEKIIRKWGEVVNPENLPSVVYFV